jgi:hypothetical protein
MVTINRHPKANLTDALSQSSYEKINTHNTTIKSYRAANFQTSEVIENVISTQYNELTHIHSSIKSQLYKINNFIKGSTFNSALGYCSYGYIQEKYPIINALSPSSIYKNTIIRARYYKKFNTESELISQYLNKTNPISEGERVLLILNSLENVINITLENETY